MTGYWIDKEETDMLSAEGREIRIGDTIFVTCGGDFVEHEVAGFEGNRVLFLDPQTDGQTGCLAREAHLYPPMFDHRLEAAFA